MILISRRKNTVSKIYHLLKERSHLEKTLQDIGQQQRQDNKIRKEDLRNNNYNYIFKK